MPSKRLSFYMIDSAFPVWGLAGALVWYKLFNYSQRTWILSQLCPTTHSILRWLAGARVGTNTPSIRFPNSHAMKELVLMWFLQSESMKDSESKQVCPFLCAVCVLFHLSLYQPADGFLALGSYPSFFSWHLRSPQPNSLFWLLYHVTEVIEVIRGHSEQGGRSQEILRLGSGLCASQASGSFALSPVMAISLTQAPGHWESPFGLTGAPLKILCKHL